MDVSVMMASGDTDTWSEVEKAEIEPRLGGALVVRSSEAIMAIYAPGMWMKVEYLSA